MLKRNKIKNLTNTIKSANIHDFSKSLTSNDFDLDEVIEFGVESKIISMAFDPVQSLLAFGTVLGQVYIFGQSGVSSKFINDKRDPIVDLRFIKGVFLVVLTRGSDLVIYSLLSQQILRTENIVGQVTCMASDPTIDWVYLGLGSGSIVVYDVACGHTTRHKIMNLTRDYSAKDTNVVKMQINPRDIGTLLVCYSAMAVTYSVTEQKVKQRFEYTLPAFAPGGDSIMTNKPRRPPLLSASYHPNGLNILTVHLDGSLVFWDANNGTLILARTIFDTEVNKPARAPPGSGSPDMRYNSIVQVEWVCEDNPENTSLLICGGDTLGGGNAVKNLVKIEFDTTPKYSITSYEKMASFYANQKNLQIFPITIEDTICKTICLPRKDPFFDGNHDPSFVLVLLKSGTLQLLKWPVGDKFNDSKVFPPNLWWLAPKLTFMSAFEVPNLQWTGIFNATAKGTDAKFIKGGCPAPNRYRSLSQDGTNVIVTGHEDGMVKIWSNQRTELDSSAVIDVDSGFCLGSQAPSAITKVDLSGNTTELVVGNDRNEVILYRFGENRFYNPAMSKTEAHRTGNRNKIKSFGSSLLANIEQNASPSEKVTFCPQYLLRAPPSKFADSLTITCLKSAHLEFLFVAYNDGQFVVIDNRVQDIILLDNVNNPTYGSGAGRGNSLVYISSSEFSIMRAVPSEPYSSLILHCGTSDGRVLNFQILPGSSPNSISRFKIAPCGQFAAVREKVRAVIPINAANGHTAVARPQEFAQLSSGVLIKGLLVVLSATEVRVLKDGSTVAHKVFDHGVGVLSSGLIYANCKSSVANGAQEVGAALAVLLSNSTFKVFTLPSLAEISKMPLVSLEKVDTQLGKQSCIMHNGDIALRKNLHSGSLISITSFGQVHSNKNDTLFTDDAKIPVRPAFNTLQWARGTKLASVFDLEETFHGDKRLASHYQKETDASNNCVSVDIIQKISDSTISATRNDADPYGYQSNTYQRTATVSPHSPNTNKNNGWGFSMDNLTQTFNNTMNGLEESIANAGEAVTGTVNGAVEDTKKNAVKSYFKSKFI